MQLGITLGLPTMLTTSGLAPLNLTAPSVGDAPIGEPVSVDLGLWAPGTDLTADLLRDGAVIQTGLTGGDIVFTPADDNAVMAIRVTGTAADGGRTQAVVSAPVTARYAPPATVQAQIPQTPEIYDEDTGPQTLDLGPAFAGEALHFTVAGLNAATINATTGVLTTGTDVPISSGQVTVTAQNSGGSAAVTVDIIVEDDGDTMLTPTTMQTSVTDPITGHVYSFVAADGVTPEAREVGQYQDGTWFVLGGAGDEVRIGSILPVSTSVSTAAYTRPDNCDDVAETGAQTRWMHGAMVNPWQGVGPGATAPMGFDSYYGAGQPANSIKYRHDQNVDPGKTGAALILEEGSVVKGESFTEEGGHTAHEADKTRLLQFSCLTVAPEIPREGSFRPPIRGLDKRSYWALADLDIASHRQIIPGFRPFEGSELGLATGRIKPIQQTFAPFQEQARRWNPGARGGGCDIYGDDWYNQFAKCFATFDGDYADAEVAEIIKATVQVGVDIYGLLTDGGHYMPWQAHHAGRKGIAFMAGLLLNDQNILDQCDYNQHPEHFGVDDAYCGYVTQDMIGVQPRFYKRLWQVKFEQEHLGLAEWSESFANPDTTVANSQQVSDPQIWSRDYNVLSFDNGAMWQCLWGMKHDPTAQYYNPAYFDFADRYLQVRFGDQLDGLYDVSGNAASVGGIVTGNWFSINPLTSVVQGFKTLRDSINRPNYVTSLIPEALPKPRVTHDGSSGHLDVDFNANNLQLPQAKDVAITGYDLRWLAYAGTAETATSEADPNWIGNFDWRVIEDVTLPYELSDIPRGLKVKVQLRMNNANGPGQWLDSRKLESYDGNNNFVALHRDGWRGETNFDVPDIAAFNQAPVNFNAPSVLGSVVITGGVVTGDEGIWAENPATISTEWQWQVSDDGLTGWTDISGATASTFTTTAAQEGKHIRPGVRKTNSVGASPYVYAHTGLPVAQPTAVALKAGVAAAGDFDPGVGALGGKRLLVMMGIFANNPIIEGGTIGAYSFSSAETLATGANSGTGGANRIRQVAYIVDVPSGETSQEISFADTSDAISVAVYELTTDMQLAAIDDSVSSGATLTVNTVSGGAAFWMARGGTISFVSSTALVEHGDSPGEDDRWAFAHALGVGSGSVSVTHDREFDSNTRATLISLAPTS